MAEITSKILVVDDLLDWRITFRGLLEDEGFYVRIADASEAALALLEKASFDLAILDIRLDETNEDNVEGITLAKKIRLHWPQTQVIIITGYETPDTIVEAMKPGADGQHLVHNYILKKDAAEELIPAIKRAIAELLLSKQ